MTKLSALLLVLLLVSNAVAQTCSTSGVQGLATGLINLGVPSASVAQTSFSQTLSSFNLGTYAQVFSAFAIAGIQASSNQQFYSLVVDTVIFSNGNTQMNITLSYTNPAGTFQTTWTKVKLSWVAVSTAMQTVNAVGGSYVWAGSVGIGAPFTNGLSGAVIPNSLWYDNLGLTNDACGYINTSPPVFDTNCGAGNPNARFMAHYYIMGFQFDPSGTYSLAASVLIGAGTSADTDQGLLPAGFTIRAAIGSPALLTGPIMLIDPVGTQLKYIKIGIVITTVLDSNNYPAINTANFLYSGVYMTYTLYNVAQPVVRGTAVGQNNLRAYGLINVKYQIYGLSAFYVSKLPASVTVLNYDLDLSAINTVLFNTDDVNYMTGVRISADKWNGVINTCTPTTTTMVNIAQKSLTTVPPTKNTEQYIAETSSTLAFDYFAKGNYAAAAGVTPVVLSSNVVYTNTLYFQNITAGMTYEINFDMPVLNTLTPLSTGQTSFNVQYSLLIEGNQIFSNVLNVSTNPLTYPANTFPIRVGYIFQTANPAITVVINMPRATTTNTQVVGPSVDRTIKTLLTVTQYSLVYNPATDCCVTSCPANSGINLGLSVPTLPACVNCSAGLVYNSVTGQCQCQTGFYSVLAANTNQTQCFPCFAQLCQTCAATSNTVCSSCVSGAAFNANNVCTCLGGYYQNISLCNACPYKCANCTNANVCTTCSDNTTRNFNDNCNCLTGFYDAGVAVCPTCPVLCKTCSSATNCTSCFTENNRVLNNGLCVCATGYFQVVNPDGSLTCSKCDPSCNSCSLLATQCTDCDRASNRILGYDSLGNQVCNCISGYARNSQGNCVQSNCTADINCETCLTVLGTSTCIKCIAATFRTLVLPQSKCFCRTGYWDNNGECTPCPSGCANCTSNSTCNQCVVSATSNGDGSCKCPDSTYFTTSPIRYCNQCANYTISCISLTQALSCQTNFTLVNGLCVCPRGNFINNLGQCVPCINGCATCNSSTNCLACVEPLLLQANTCVNRCGPGFYQNGFLCTPCSTGCVSCTGPNICLICGSGRLAYNGFCYNTCPAGSVAANNSATCVDCNVPCATCVEHPSKCTTCTSCCGSLFNFQCLASCPVGTYSINGTCQYCAYSCATCLGSNATCTSCATGKILYNGACYDQCPYVMIGGVCTFNCAKGLYKTPINTCIACDSNCLTCEINPKNCTSCPTGKGFAYNGLCVQTCPTNFFGDSTGVCIACNPECNGCTGSCTNCVNCAAGYYKCGALCVKTCPPNQFADNNAGLCVTCNPKCKTCSSLQFCTTCANPQAVPVNGVCNDCSYPCNTCNSGPAICTSCVAGFNLIGTTCIAACPTGAYSSNGVCVCNSGVIYSNQCVASCPTGFGNIGGQCQQCGANCAGCSGSAASCTSCVNGYALDKVSGTCQLAPSCQFGQYYSQSSSACTRICPQGTFFYENVCLTACLSGFNDNGVGGCVAAVTQSGCSFPYYLSNGVCISNCPSGTYPDSTKRICQSCSSNCFSCLTNTFCYACNAGFDLKNGVCIASSVNCPSGQYRYNGVCYSTCPAGTCIQGNFCQRTCPAGTFSFNNGCYRTCPTKYTTADACVNTCPTGTSLINGVCQVGSQACPSGQFRDGSSSSCQNCQYPCSQCSLTASYCTACTPGLTLSQNLCVSTSNTCGSGKYQDLNRQCQSCPAKCATCLSATICSSCAPGYNFNGADCVVALAQLKAVTLSVSSVTKRGNSAFITVCPNIIPNGLSLQQQNNFFTVVPASADTNNVAYINQWLSSVDSGCVTVGVNYNSFPVQSAVFLAVNAQSLASSYLSIGYTADASSFVSAGININLPATPANVIPPSNAVNNNADTKGELPSIYAIRVSADNILE